MKRTATWFRAKAGRRDGPHAAIRDGLRKLGHVVIDTASCGGGVPDMLVYPRVSSPDGPVWLEVKRPKGGKLRTSQVAWRLHAHARGIRVAVVTSLAEALTELARFELAEVDRAAQRTAGAP